eukprot:scaffold8911_cov166-Amphora_coffeaeformis.AAC.3
MDQPETLNQTEPLVGRGAGVAIACAYLAIISPWRLAGFPATAPIQFPSVFVWKLPIQQFHPRLVWDALELLALLFVAGDRTHSWIRRRISRMGQQQPQSSPGSSNTVMAWLCPLKFKLFQVYQSFHLERWLPLPRLDTVILGSYMIQNATHGYQTSSWFGGLYTEDQVGMSVWQAVGLVRAAAVWRVSFFARCAEKAAILQCQSGQGNETWRM